MRNNIKEMINILGDNQIIKFKTMLGGKDSELTYLFREQPGNKKYSNKEIKEFIMYLHLNNMIYSDHEFKESFISSNGFISICLNWDNIIKNNLLSKENKMYMFYKNNYSLFKIYEAKSKYFMLIEYFGYLQPSQLISSLDQIFLLFLINPDLFHKQYPGVNGIDVFGNLFSYVENIPIVHKDLFKLEKYLEILECLNVKISNELELELKKEEAFLLDTIEKEKERLRKLQEDENNIIM